MLKIVYIYIYINGYSYSHQYYDFNFTSSSSCCYCCCKSSSSIHHCILLIPNSVSLSYNNMNIINKKIELLTPQCKSVIVFSRKAVELGLLSWFKYGCCFVRNCCQAILNRPSIIYPTTCFFNCSTTINHKVCSEKFASWKLRGGHYAFPRERNQQEQNKSRIKFNLILTMTSKDND